MRLVLTPISILLLFIQSVYAVDPVSAGFSSPRVFIENRGQVIDQSGRKNDEVKFIYHEGLFNLQLRTDGFSYETLNATNYPDGKYLCVLKREKQISKVGFKLITIR